MYRGRGRGGGMPYNNGMPMNYPYIQQYGGGGGYFDGAQGALR